MDNERTCGLNYEAEYERLRAELEKANYENRYLRDDCKELRHTIGILEAQMYVVRLIFGGLNRE